MRCGPSPTSCAAQYRNSSERCLYPVPFPRQIVRKKSNSDGDAEADHHRHLGLSHDSRLVYFPSRCEGADPNAEEAAKKAIQELIGRGRSSTVIARPRRRLFTLAGIVVADKTKLAEITLPVPALLTDEMYTKLVGDKVIRVGKPQFRSQGLQGPRQAGPKPETRLRGRAQHRSRADRLSHQAGDPGRDLQAGSSVKHGERLASEKPPEDIAKKSSHKGQRRRVALTANRPRDRIWLIPARASAVPLLRSWTDFSLLFPFRHGIAVREWDHSSPHSAPSAEFLADAPNSSCRFKRPTR